MLLREFLCIGSTPVEEPCAQVGHPDYHAQARIECRAYMEQLRRLYPEPDNGYFKVKSFSRDFGTYYEVIAVYDEEDETAVEWALSAESGADHWDDIALEYIRAERRRAA